jgi:transcription initiation factor TFIID subunit TAF12
MHGISQASWAEDGSRVLVAFAEFEASSPEISSHNVISINLPPPLVQRKHRAAQFVLQSTASGLTTPGLISSNFVWTLAVQCFV